LAATKNIAGTHAVTGATATNEIINTGALTSTDVNANPTVQNNSAHLA